MIFVIIGHRGSGKSSLLKRMPFYKFKAETYDLDSLIEENENLSIKEIFSLKGEDFFRKKEKEIFNQLYKSCDHKKDHYIALGAGFNFDLPKEIFILWLRRSTDKDGRIFLDRPRLKENLSPIEEYFHFYKDRDMKYKNLSDGVIFLQEGFSKENDFEKLIFSPDGSLSCGGCLTIPKNFFKNKNFIEYKLNKLLKWGINLFELRDDFLSEEEIKFLLKRIPKEKSLISFRKNFLNFSFEKNISFDWDLNLGLPREDLMSRPKPIVNAFKHGNLGIKKETTTQIVSLHKREQKEDLELLFKRIDLYKDNFYLKLAVPILSWIELEKGHRWWLKDPERRSFLPISDEGRWSWYRLLHKNRMRINFFTTGQNFNAGQDDKFAVSDQPLLSDWVHLPKKMNKFAAIVGNPVNHSLTPYFHKDFFFKENIGILRINLDSEDFFKAFCFLKELGLIAAAVTSPLKKSASDFVSDHKYEAINTMVLNKNKWIGENTDQAGADTFLKDISLNSNVVVWGGGGTLSILRKTLPKAIFYSARSSLPRDQESEPYKTDYQILIWAAGNNKEIQSPPREWKIKKVMDLSYTNDSRGKEYALVQGAEYENGLGMFLAQAQAQQEFWLKYIF